MDRELLERLRWAYNYLCLPRETLLIRKLHHEICERNQGGRLFLDTEEALVVERALSVCRAFQDLERDATTPLQIVDRQGRSSPLLLTDAEIEARSDSVEHCDS